MSKKVVSEFLRALPAILASLGAVAGAAHWGWYQALCGGVIR